jgi:hypothetical protein
MSRIINFPSRRVKPTRHSVRPSAPFGSGILPRPARFEPPDEDKAAAVLMFADDADWDVLLIAGLEACEACGRPAEPGELECGLCCVCMARAEEASIACQYYGAGMGWHTY